MNYDLGYPAAHPMHRYDPKPRFYWRTSVRWPEVPNALPSVTPDRRLDLPARDDLVMIHDRNRTVAEAIERALRYAPAEAQSMVDRGEVFTARAMLRTLGGKAYRQFVVAEPWREGVTGLPARGRARCFSFLRLGRVLAALGSETNRGRRSGDAPSRHRRRGREAARPHREENRPDAASWPRRGKRFVRARLRSPAAASDAAGSSPFEDSVEHAGARMVRGGVWQTASHLSPFVMTA